MIISRTPFRVSFFGGGTDYPGWYRDNGGAVLSTTIDKYCYLACRHMPPFFDVRYRVVYSRIELANSIEEIEHPSVRACLDHLGFSDQRMEIVHYADLPSRTGIGSSSSFTVGLLSVLSALKGRMLSKWELARLAIEVEQDVLKETVGSQDQVSAAFGGFNLIRFDDRGFHVQPVTVSRSRLQQLQDNLLLVYTGISRVAAEVATEQVRNISQKADELRRMRVLVDVAVEVLTSDRDLAEFGRLLHESWMIKATLSSRITNPMIQDVYARATAAGALGGKLLGAGGGGFMLFYVDRDRRDAVSESLRGLLQVPFQFEDAGSQLIYYQPN